MTKLSWFGVIFSFFLLLVPAAVQAQDEKPDEWQVSISGQIQAFRDKNAPVALSFATQPFKDNYESPEQFFIAIIASGYSPIMESRSHSFGPFKVLEPGVVMQDVKFVGNDQSLYEAIYQMTKEADGWHVGGVQLVKTTGVGV
ncbi:MAG: DUF4864 domain-containing protein [Devosia sp.]